MTARAFCTQYSVRAPVSFVLATAGRQASARRLDHRCCRRQGEAPGGGKESARSETATADEPSPRQCLEALFRSHLKNGFTFFPMDTSMENDFAEILDELGPEALQDLIDNFDVH